jgi:glycosyltransferase involved in cell wall biosynthesis
MRVALVKPDWAVRGGAEAVVDRFERQLVADGHEVTRRTIPVPALPRTPFGVAVPPAVWDQAAEYFRYLAAADAAGRLELGGYDAVVSTHAPSFVVDHPRHLSLFFHHLRIFYDLEEVYVAAGLAGDPEVHAAARDRIRRLDQAHLERVTWFSPNSEVTAARLEAFNGLTNVTVHHAGRAVEVAQRADATPGADGALCVGRCELTKRTELAVAAAHLNGRPLTVAGDGGRLAWAVDLDRRIAAGEVTPAALGDRDLWLNPGQVVRRGKGGALGPSPVTFAGRLERGALSRAYRQARCVVAPAFDEDYGLTAVEAMAHGRPVVVCRDGGGLTTIVEHEVDGLVVEPTVAAIATAVERLATDADLAQRLGEAGLAKAETFTWRRTADELRQAFAQVAA